MRVVGVRFRFAFVGLVFGHAAGVKLFQKLFKGVSWHMKVDWVSKRAEICICRTGSCRLSDERSSDDVVGVNVDLS